jgi:hypothetical protein
LRRCLPPSPPLQQPAESRPPVADHPDPAVASASNAFFRALAGWARGAIPAARDQAGLSRAAWEEKVRE